jgi:hypothetical protein
MTRTYPTPSTTTYYINKYLIDDMYRVDFSRKLQHQPIWGYDSRKFDFIASGKELVTGNIIINYRYPGYLRNVIKEHEFNQKELNKIISQKRIGPDVESLTAEGVLGDLDSVGTVADKSAVIAASIAGAAQDGLEAKKSKGKVIEALKASLESRFFLDNHGTEEEDLTTSAVFSSPLDDATLVLFDMSVRYGFQGVPGGYVRIFKDVALLGESQTVSAAAGVGSDMSSSAQAILEIYPFVCRTIVTKKYN